MINFIDFIVLILNKIIFIKCVTTPSPSELGLMHMDSLQCPPRTQVAMLSAHMFGINNSIK